DIGPRQGPGKTGHGTNGAHHPPPARRAVARRDNNHERLAKQPARSQCPDLSSVQAVGRYGIHSGSKRPRRSLPQRRKTDQQRKSMTRKTRVFGGDRFPAVILRFALGLALSVGWMAWHPQAAAAQGPG